MKANNLLKALPLSCILGALLAVSVSCTENDPLPEPPGSKPPSSGNDSTQMPVDSAAVDTPVVSYRGYAHPDGTFLLNCGDRITENGSVTYIAPDGTVEEDVYKKVNGTELGNEAQAMCLYNGKFYILCTDYFRLEGKPNDGALIIVDAETFRKEKAYRLEELRFPIPDGVNNPDFNPIPNSLSNLAVMDEQNIFICDVNGLYRFDSTTGELNLLEESFRVDNGGAGVAGRVYDRNIVIKGDRAYVAVGGWTSATDEYNLGIYEYKKGSNKISRKLGIANGGYVSGLCAGEKDTIWFATFADENKGSNKIYCVDSRSFTVLSSKRVDGNLNSGFTNTPGISVAGLSFYYSGRTTRLSRFDYQKGRSEFLVDALQDEPKANYLTCNPMFDPKKQLLYLSTTEENMEGFPTTDHILVYDCSVSPVVLHREISGKTSYVSGIYPVSMFYKK